MAPNGLPVAAHPLCGICTKHQGSHPSDLERRNRQHLEQWQLDFERQQQKYEARQAKRDADADADAVISRLRETIEKLKDEISSKPVQFVERNLDQETVDEALRERDNANAACVRVYKTLAQVRVIHHDTGRGLCKCGKKLTECAETEIVDGNRSFLRWEARQVGHVRRNGPYGSALPEGHPAIINPRWSSPGEAASLTTR